MLVVLGSRIVQDAAGAMPRFKTWVQSCLRSLMSPFDLEGYMRRSVHFARYKEKLSRAEAVGLMSSGPNGIMGFDSMFRGSMTSSAAGPPKPPSWPYQERRGLSRRSRSKTLSEELEKRQRYKERGSDDDDGFDSECESDDD